MIPEKKEQNDNKEKNKSESENSLNNSTKENITSDYAIDGIKKINQPDREREQFSRADKIQIGMLILNFLTLMAFIWLGTIQISKTNDALERADTSNVITRESLDFIKQTTLASDSSTKNSLAIAESSLVIAQKSFEVNKLNMIIMNTANLNIQIKTIEFNEQQFKIIVIINNIGETAASNLSLKASREHTYSRDNFFQRKPRSLLSGNIILPDDSVLVIIHTERGYMQQIYEDISTQKRRAEVWGIITYDDIYGNKWEVGFYYILDPITRIFEIPNGWGTHKKIIQKGVISP